MDWIILKLLAGQLRDQLTDINNHIVKSKNYRPIWEVSEYPDLQGFSKLVTKLEALFLLQQRLDQLADTQCHTLSQASPPTAFPLQTGQE